ncbi:MAG: VTT domain-containing protein [Anaerolineales bacterium]|nr:VTT domain-containing protein [Anaerolineales bacterium]
MKKANNKVTGRKSKVEKKKEERGKKQVEKVKKAKSTKPSDLRPAALDQKPKSNLTTNLLRIVAVLAVIGITVYIYSIRDRVEEFTQYGYFGIFLIMLLANATVILPAPGVAVVFAMGSVFNPLGVAFAAGAGGTIGELTGYLAGFSGQAVVENTQIYNRIMPWIKKYGAWVILVLSAIPNPFFDIAGIAAGIAKIPLWQFLLACWVGQTIKMAMFAFAGFYSIDWIASFYD